MNYRMIFKTLGKILSIEGILLIIPLILSLIYQENIFYAYLISMGLMLLVGLPLALLKPSNRGMYVRDGFVLVGLCWIGLSLFGAFHFLYLAKYLLISMRYLRQYLDLQQQAQQY